MTTNNLTILQNAMAKVSAAISTLHITTISEYHGAYGKVKYTTDIYCPNKSDSIFYADGEFDLVYTKLINAYGNVIQTYGGIKNKRSKKFYATISYYDTCNTDYIQVPSRSAMVVYRELNSNPNIKSITIETMHHKLVDCRIGGRK